MVALGLLKLLSGTTYLCSMVSSVSSMAVQTVVGPRRRGRCQLPVKENGCFAVGGGECLFHVCMPREVRSHQEAPSSAALHLSFEFSLKLELVALARWTSQGAAAPLLSLPPLH